MGDRLGTLGAVGILFLCFFKYVILIFLEAEAEAYVQIVYIHQLMLEYILTLHFIYTSYSS